MKILKARNLSPAIIIVAQSEKYKIAVHTWFRNFLNIFKNCKTFEVESIIKSATTSQEFILF